MRALLVLAALAPLAGCVGGQRPDEAAVLACVRDAGVSGTFQVSTQLRTSGYQVRLLEGSDVSPEQAVQANLCLSRLTARPAATPAAPATSPGAITTPRASPSRAGCALEIAGGAGYVCPR